MPEGLDNNLQRYTFGDVFVNEDGLEEPRERQMTYPETFFLKMRLDYILILDNGSREENYPNLEVDVDASKIEPHFTLTNSDSGINLPVMPFTQISDHYGASIKIDYKP